MENTDLEECAANMGQEPERGFDQPPPAKKRPPLPSTAVSLYQSETQHHETTHRMELTREQRVEFAAHGSGGVEEMCGVSAGSYLAQAALPVPSHQFSTYSTNYGDSFKAQMAWQASHPTEDDHNAACAPAFQGSSAYSSSTTWQSRDTGAFYDPNQGAHPYMMLSRQREHVEEQKKAFGNNPVPTALPFSQSQFRDAQDAPVSSTLIVPQHYFRDEYEEKADSETTDDVVAESRASGAAEREEETTTASSPHPSSVSAGHVAPTSSPKGGFTSLLIQVHEEIDDENHLECDSNAEDANDGSRKEKSFEKEMQSDETPARHAKMPHTVENGAKEDSTHSYDETAAIKFPRRARERSPATAAGAVHERAAALARAKPKKPKGELPTPPHVTLTLPQANLNDLPFISSCYAPLQRTARAKGNTEIGPRDANNKKSYQLHLHIVYDRSHRSKPYLFEEERIARLEKDLLADQHMLHPVGMPNTPHAVANILNTAPMAQFGLNHPQNELSEETSSMSRLFESNYAMEVTKEGEKMENIFFETTGTSSSSRTCTTSSTTPRSPHYSAKTVRVIAFQAPILNSRRTRTLQEQLEKIRGASGRREEPQTPLKRSASASNTSIIDNKKNDNGESISGSPYKHALCGFPMRKSLERGEKETSPLQLVYQSKPFEIARNMAYIDQCNGVDGLLGGRVQLNLAISIKSFGSPIFFALVEEGTSLLLAISNVQAWMQNPTESQQKNIMLDAALYCTLEDSKERRADILKRLCLRPGFKAGERQLQDSQTNILSSTVDEKRLNAVLTLKKGLHESQRLDFSQRPLWPPSGSIPQLFAESIFFRNDK